MKSVAIKTASGKILVKVIHKKSGEYELVKDVTLKDVDVEVRDDKNRKVLFGST